MKKKIINNHQQGAALVIVMAFLAAGLIVGISGMNASYIDERLAWNYLAVTQAQQAAEKGAAQAIAQGDVYDYANKECSDIAVSSDDTSLWKEIFSKAIDDRYTISSDIVECNDDGFIKKLSRGEVTGSDEEVVQHFIVFSLGSGGGAFDIDKDLAGTIEESDLETISSNSLFTGGPLVRNGNSQTKGPPAQDNQGNSVPNPVSVIDYVESIKDSSQVIENCDGDFERGPDSKIVFCDGDFSSKKIEKGLDGLYVIAKGSISGNKGNGVNLKDDVKTFFIAGNTINFKGFGNNSVSGGIWAGGSVSMSGGPDICGPVIVRGAATLNGGSSVDVESDACKVTGGSAGQDWRSL